MKVSPMRSVINCESQLQIRLAQTLSALACALGASLIGCSEMANRPNELWHTKFRWSALDYFEDPKVIALCHAIEADNIAEIDRLAADGANVNTQGDGKMTPLLWAYPDNKLERFTRLLGNLVPIRMLSSKAISAQEAEFKQEIQLRIWLARHRFRDILRPFSVMAAIQTWLERG
jgi:hypothetical protein